MKSQLRLSLTAVLLGVVLIVPAAGSSLDKVKFPYSPIAYHSLPWLVAKEAKLFEKRGLDVDPIFAGASSVIVQSMLAGEAEIAGMAGPAVMTNVLKGGDVIQVAGLVKQFTVPMYVQPSIKEVSQLHGQKIGVTRFGSVSHFTAKAILEKSGVTDAVILQTGGYNESMAALSTGALSGAMIPAPQSVLLREKGFRELIGIKQIRNLNIRFIEQGIVARRAYAQRNPEIIKRFIAGVYDGLRKIHDDKTFTLAVLAKYTKINRQNMIDESYRAALDAFTKDPRVPPEVFKDLADHLIALKLLEPDSVQKTPLAAYYDNRYVDELEKEGFFQKLWQDR